MSRGMTSEERADELAERIRNAVRRDNRGIAANVIKTTTDLTRASLASELRDIGALLNGLVYVNTEERLPDSAKQEICEAAGKKLGLRHPEILWIATRGASSQNFLAVLNEIQTILTETKS
jgi:hypothetical protein